MSAETQPVRLSVSFQRQLHAALSERAAAQYRPLASIVQEACAHFLQAGGDHADTRGLGQNSKVRPRGGGD